MSEVVICTINNESYRFHFRSQDCPEGEVHQVRMATRPASRWRRPTRRMATRSTTRWWWAAPSEPPPSFVPTQAQATPFAIDSGAISFCQFRFTYLWLRNGQNFWYYPIFIGRRSVAGFRWTGRSWVFFGVDTNQITSFTCQ